MDKKCLDIIRSIMSQGRPLRLDMLKKNDAKEAVFLSHLSQSLQEELAKNGVYFSKFHVLCILRSIISDCRSRYKQNKEA
jgi:hypothetical protein